MRPQEAQVRIRWRAEMPAAYLGFFLFMLNRKEVVFCETEWELY